MSDYLDILRFHNGDIYATKDLVRKYLKQVRGMNIILARYKDFVVHVYISFLGSRGGVFSSSTVILYEGNDPEILKSSTHGLFHIVPSSEDEAILFLKKYVDEEMWKKKPEIEHEECPMKDLIA